MEPFALYAVSFFSYGLMNGLLGPCVPGLAAAVGVTPANLAPVLFWRGLGSICGGFASSVVLERTADLHRDYARLCALWALTLVILPWATSQSVLAGVFFVGQACANASAAFAGAGITWRYAKQMGFQQNASNSLYGLGATLAPMLATALPDAVGGAVGGFRLVALLLVGLAVVLAANPGPGAAREKAQALLDEPVRRGPVCACLVLLGVESCLANGFGVWLYDYLQRLVGMPDQAAELNTLYWACFTCSRLGMAFVVLRVSAERILAASVVSLFASCVLFSLPALGPAADLAGGGAGGSGSVAGATPWLLAVGIVGIGVAVGPVYSNAVTALRGRSFISGRTQGLIRVASAAGGLLGPTLGGWLQAEPLELGGAALPGLITSCAGAVLLSTPLLVC